MQISPDDLFGQKGMKKYARHGPLPLGYPKRRCGVRIGSFWGIDASKWGGGGFLALMGPKEKGGKLSIPYHKVFFFFLLQRLG